MRSYLVIPMCVCDHKAFTGCGFSSVNDDLLLQLMLTLVAISVAFSETSLSKKCIMHIIAVYKNLYFFS